MADLSEKLSAYIDGELSPEEATAIELQLETDVAAQEELNILAESHVMAQEAFEDQLNGPVQLDLIRQIKSAELIDPQAPPARPIWGAMAASLVALVIGGAGGYYYKDQTKPPVQTAGWLADIADYHGVYASQGRHLVEVGADESDHIMAWLGKTIGAEFNIPDLSSFGMTFEGGRLLVANGKPVAQLMYRQPDGTVLALCLQSSGKAPGTTTDFNAKTINGFDFVSWTTDGADYVVIGPQGQPDLNAIAEAAALEV